MPELLFAPGDIRTVRKADGAALSRIALPDGQTIVVTVWHCAVIAARVFQDGREATRFIEGGWENNGEPAY